MATNYEKLKALLRELFQMDQSDLDFGLYRIMNAKRDEIERFLEHDLLPQVKAELARHTNLDTNAKKSELDEAIENATRLGMNPDAVPKVQQLREELKQGGDLDALENEVFSHLYNFFRRYYHEGDFLSLRRYKEGVYAIPYEGEEVKLYWANHDQYYIKSTEYLRNYTFKLRDNRRVHFKVVEADTEADNNKAQNGKERRFILAETNPVAVESGELSVRFNYQTDSRKQAELNAAAVAAVLGNTTLIDWLSALGELRPTEKNPQRTLLAKHLDDFTARYTFDYFIHKDLGGFLRRELDFFIKNEIMHLDDVEDEAAPKVEVYLSKIKALRKIAHKIIAFLEQLENFQKKLWLKKKFVVETNYCVTLDRVPEELYTHIIENKAQIEEWKQLFTIQSVESSTIGPGFSEPPTIQFLEANPSLVIDTKYFDESFKRKLIASCGDFDAQCGGVLFHGENLHGLMLIGVAYKGRVSTIFIDPPYNTGKDEFIYKDQYRRSSWISMIASRVVAGRRLLADTGIFWCTIDDHELADLNQFLVTTFGKEQALPTVVWQHSVQGKGYEGSISVHHNYVVGFRNTPEASVGLLGRTEEHNRNYSNPDNDPKGEWRTGDVRNSLYRPNLIYDLPTPSGKVIKPPEKGWRWSKETMQAKIASGEVVFVDNETRIIRKIYLRDQEGRVPESIWFAKDVGSSRSANAELKDLFGETPPFDTPKPTGLVANVVALSGDDNSVVLDCFGGSGTTADSVVRLNAKDEGGRRYLIMESGNHFDLAILPRMKKVVYSRDWKDGKPVSREGFSHLFKYIRLESYEDCLNNLELKRTKTQDDLLTQAKDFREDYTLRYMLDVETRGSASLLNVQKFTDPFSYKLKVSTGTVGETKEVNVDLVETFNWLVGLKVKHIDHIRNVRVVEGTNPQGDRVLILWRNVGEAPNDKLDEWFKTQGYNTRDQEYDLIYVNGDNNLENLRRGDQTWKVRVIEEDFHRLMWECLDV
jgi:adenine-specific DNA-methyltransferase